METSILEIDGLQIPVCAVNTVIVGAGAAGMGCAVRLWEAFRDRGVERPQDRIAVVTAGRTLGASRMSGSDKQTYYKMGTSPRVSDCAEDFARTLTAGGCMHGDLALAEALGSLRGFYALVDAGVPFPRDPWGAFPGYKTDHDPYERATSAGPKTSRFMSECLEARVRRCGVPILDRLEAVELLADGTGSDRRVLALVCIDRRKISQPHYGLTAILAENFVLAAGGPGEIYEASVYPRGQTGMHGLALRAGLPAVNLTESQYGLASTRFRWNVSGTYMQVVPRIFSTDDRGRDEREFLTDYFPDMRAMATNIFLKGYQWPFDAQRIVGGSSLVDMAVHQETVVRGRRVWMDFLRSPVGRQGWAEFSLERLGDEARAYLLATGASQARPIDRLAHMNPPAIDIYAENGIDLYNEPLEIAVCAQHHNGGMEVDAWWQSPVRHTFVIGEMAGTHGVKRPGGAALNAGQVGAIRAAEYIAGVYGAPEPQRSRVEGRLVEGLHRVIEGLRAREAATATSLPTPPAALKRIARLMTCHAAHLRSRSGAAKTLRELLDLQRRIERERLKVSSRRRLVEALQVEHQLLAAIAMVQAILEQFDRGAGSRGSHCMLADDGEPMHEKLVDPATAQPYRFRPENLALRERILRLRYDPASPSLFAAEDVPVRPIPHREIAFEPAWTEYREGAIYGIARQ